MWKSAETDPIPVPTGTIPLVSNPKCLDQALLRTNQDLAAACACESATNSTINLTNTYIGQVKQYNRELVIYNQQVTQQTNWSRCANDGVCLGEYANYQSEYNDNYKNFEKYTIADYPCKVDPNISNETKKQECAKYGTGWVSSSDQVKAKCGSSPPTVGDQYACCTNKCKRTPELALQDWKTYFRGQEGEPYPYPLPTQPQVPQFDAQIAITCCSQNFDNISAGNTVKIYDITQQCSAEVNRYIQQVAAGELPTGTLPPNYDAPPQGTPPDDTAPAGLQTFAIVLIVVAVLVFIAMMIWVGVRLRKRSQKAKTPAPTPLAPPS